MDFLEDLEMYNKAMENAYLIITKRTTLDDIYYEFEQEKELKEFFLPFDPIQEDGRSPDIIDMVIEYFKQDINVYERPFDTFYKNGLYHDSVATGDYIFHIDADEIPEEFLIRNVKKIIQDTNAEILFIPRRNLHNQKNLTFF